MRQRRTARPNGAPLATASFRQQINPPRSPSMRIHAECHGLIGFCLLVSVCGLSSCGRVEGATPAAAAPIAEAPVDRPSIVFILPDDEDTELHAFMPKTKALLHEQGTTFDNYFVTYSLCCPSRATTLRGQYPHSTGVRGNTPPLGGFETFRALGRETST